MNGLFIRLEAVKGGEYKIVVAGRSRRVATVVKKRGRYQVKHPITAAEYAGGVSTLLASLNGEIELQWASA